MKKVLIAIDGGVFSEKTAHKGYEMARSMNAVVAMIYVVDPALATGSDGVSASDEIKTFEQAGRDILERLKKELGDKDIWLFVKTGSPAPTIIKVADEWEASILVLGTHGRTGFSHLLMGSVAEHVVRHSSIPVLVVPATAR